MGGAVFDWHALGALAYLGAAVACALAAIWVFQRETLTIGYRRTLATALVLSALWSLLAVGFGPVAVESAICWSLATLAWLAVLYRAFPQESDAGRPKAVRPVVVVLAGVVALQILVVMIATRYAAVPQVAQLAMQIALLFDALVAIGALVLVHNLFVGRNKGQGGQGYIVAALGLLFAFELNLNTIGYLGDLGVPGFVALRSIVLVVAAALVALGARGDNIAASFRPSRAVAFQSASLLLIGAYLLAMIAVAQSLATLGAGPARLAQAGFVFAAVLGVVLLLPSRKWRGWLRVTLAKHLFSHRYDYRAEWLRFTDTIGRETQDARSLSERTIKALADITDSASGALYRPADSGMLEIAARWQWPAADLPPATLPLVLGDSLVEGQYIVEMDALREGDGKCPAADLVPEALVEGGRAWAMVPLVHFDRLVGLAVLSRPVGGRALDWEDLDLLRVVGRQLASYLAEEDGQDALREAARFDEFNRRIAFVMHDIKNLASQMALLSRNAERHADNPAFRKDMLVTLRNSSDKLGALLARLGRYGTGAARERQTVDATAMLRAIAARFAAMHPVELSRDEPLPVMAEPIALEQALDHLVRNAVDASDAASAVVLEAVADGGHARISVVDAGHGMEPDFLRTQLFKPFVSTKSGGFGIGAHEARELVRGMGGRLEVQSHAGLGTRFTVIVPIANGGAVLEPLNQPEAA